MEYSAYFSDTAKKAGYYTPTESTLDGQSERNSLIASTRPYIIIITNKNSFITEFRLFGSSQNAGAFNYGNESGIEIQYGLSGYSYDELLVDAVGKSMVLGRIRIDLLDSHTENLEHPLCARRINCYGEEGLYKLEPYTALRDIMKTMVEIPCKCELDGDTSIVGSLAGNSSIRMLLFPLHSYSEKIGGSTKQPPFKGLGRPQTGYTQTMRFGVDEADKKLKLEAEEREYERIKYLLLICTD